LCLMVWSTVVDCDVWRSWMTVLRIPHQVDH
jgi:hypothetical protein